jgi:hypothetical protein
MLVRDEEYLKPEGENIAEGARHISTVRAQRRESSWARERILQYSRVPRPTLRGEIVKAKRIQEQPRTYLLIFETGDEIASVLKTFAQEQQLAGSSFKAIGGQLQ